MDIPIHAEVRCAGRILRRVGMCYFEPGDGSDHPLRGAGKSLSI